MRLRRAAARGADGLNEHVWQTVVAMAIAARALDPTVYAARGKTLEGQVQTAVGYAHFLLGRVMVQRLNLDKPSEHQLVELLSEATGYLAVMGKFTQEDAMLVAREQFGGLIDGAPRGIFFVMYATILLGALCDDPARDLTALRPWVRAKCDAMTTRYPGRFEYLRLS